MNYLFLFLDEELTNNRIGRQHTSYDSRELAFWFQFYSLFCDRLYVPANFLLDSNLTPDFLRELNVLSGESTLRGGGDVPFRILLDTSRFKSRTFRDLLDELEADESYITMRKHQSAEQTVHFCDGPLSYQITPCDMSARLDPQESIEQLRAEAFNPDHNVALAADTLKHLQECLEEITRREQTTVYGRNFYYSVWGYGHTRVQREIEDQYKDITMKYYSLRGGFKTAVDYVSNSLKAKFAGEGLKESIELTIPREYDSVIMPRDKGALLDPARIKTSKPDLAARPGALLSVDAILRMTASQLQTLHKSSEYLELRATLGALKPSNDLDEGEKMKTAGCLDAYLRLVERVLTPKRSAVDAGLRLFGNFLTNDNGISIALIAGPFRKMRLSFYPAPFSA